MDEYLIKTFNKKTKFSNTSEWNDDNLIEFEDDLENELNYINKNAQIEIEEFENNLQNYEKDLVIDWNN